MIESDGAQAAAERRELIRKLNPIGRIRLRLAARLHEYASDWTRGDLNLTWITDSMAAGGSIRVRAYQKLQNLGITGVIDLRAEACDDRTALAKVGIELLHLPTPDRYAPAPDTLEQGVRWARERLQAGGKVFAHCEHGVGRGPLMICCVLVSEGLAGPEALEQVQARRWQTAPNDRQIEGLLAFESHWRAEYGLETRMDASESLRGGARIQDSVMTRESMNRH